MLLQYSLLISSSLNSNGPYFYLGFRRGDLFSTGEMFLISKEGKETVSFYLMKAYGVRIISFKGDF